MTQHAEELFPTRFRLVQFNPRRFSRGAPAALVEVPGGSLLWMTRGDIAANVLDHGADAGLLDAERAYKNPRQEIRNGY